MAANDYYYGYNSSHNESFHSSRREDAPLPPLPASGLPSNPSPHANNAYDISPISSPFEDQAYPYSRPDSQKQAPYDSNTPAASSRYSYNDPFADKNAIPLQQQKPGADFTTFPTNPELENGGYPPRDPLGHRRRPPEDGRRGWFRGPITWACFFLSLVQAIILIVELIRNAALTGSPIEIHPSFNPMIGPSPFVLINMGARFVPCMRTNIINGTNLGSTQMAWNCPNATSLTTPASGFCTLNDLCGFGMGVTTFANGTQAAQPNQWFRFITPIFLHGGIVHISFNLLLQLTLGRDVEKIIGTFRFLIVYFSSGIFGFVFGANFAPNGISSTGCSGALFGILAIVLLDLLYTWKARRSPGKDLLFLLLDFAIAFTLGLLPTLDNFSHIGGFLMGLVLGICVLHSPDSLRERIGLDEPPYSAVDEQGNPFSSKESGIRGFAKRPVGFFKGRKPLWWAWWLLRCGALVAVLIVFIVLVRNFYVYEHTCSWCKYLSCLPVKIGGTDWCNVGNIQITQNSGSAKRALEVVFEKAGVL